MKRLDNEQRQVGSEEELMLEGKVRHKMRFLFFISHRVRTSQSCQDTK